MEESFAQKVVHGVVFLGICFAIICLSWTEPLRYRFMSAVEITQEEHPTTPIPSPTPGAAWMNDPTRKTSLDDKVTPQSGGIRTSHGH